MQIKVPQRSAPDVDLRTYTDVEAQAMVNSVTWYHSFDLRPGLRTPGVSEMPAGAALDALQVPSDLTGKRALDVGAWDGPLTFEFERRGATAFALDVQDPMRVGFDTARRVIGSKAVHYQASVYQLPHEELSNLDVVIFRGVFYHLKYPLLAFECLSAAMKVGARLYFEGESFQHYAETLAGVAVTTGLEAIAMSDIPICLSYPDRYKDGSNWFIPNSACLRGWLEVSGFEVETMGCFTEGGAQRAYGCARKVSTDHSKLEHPLY